MSKPSPQASGPILIVDDNEDFRESLAEALASRAHAVIEARSGEEALELMDLVAPAVILIDERMPGLAGSQVIRRLRERGCRIPAIIMTATESARDVARDAGTPFWLKKPIDLDAVEAMVARVSGVKDPASETEQLRAIRELLEADCGASVTDPVVQLKRLIERKQELEAGNDDHARSSLTAMTLASLVAHELRSPLATLQLKLDRLVTLGDGLSDPQLDMIARARGVIRQADKLIEGAMTYAAIEAGRLAPTSQLVDPYDLIEDLIALSSQHARRIGVALRVERRSARPKTRSDPRILRVALANLLDNAVKFSRNHGATVDVALHTDGRELRIAVRDTGPGISEENRARVFRIFDRIEDLAHQPIEGFGLGLAIVPRLMATLGGRLELESTPGEGSCFTLVLPVET
jgi:signal transduction histidine kinase